MFCLKIVRCSVALPLAFAMAFCPWNISLAATQQPHPEGPFLVVGLDGDDEAASTALTQALRDIFRAKGEASDALLTAAELRLASGCRNDDMPCLASSGRATGAGTLYVGTLEQSEQGFRSTVHVLDTASAQEINRRSFTFEFAALSKSRISATAGLMLDFLSERPPALELDVPVHLVVEELPATNTEPLPNSDTPAPRASKPRDQRDDRNSTPSGSSEDSADDSQAPSRKRSQNRGYVAGVSASAVVSLAALGVAVATKMRLRKDGPIHQELFTLADTSISDSDPDNDVSKFSSQNLCTLARENNNGGVRNPDMAAVCDRADRLEKFNHIAIGTAIAGGVVTAILTGMWIKKHRQHGKPMASRGVRLDIAASPSSAALTLRGRF